MAYWVLRVLSSPYACTYALNVINVLTTTSCIGPNVFTAFANPQPITSKIFILKNGATAGTVIKFVNKHPRNFTKPIIEIKLGQCPTCFLRGHVAA